MNETELKKILEDHVKWLKDMRTGKRVGLTGADLSGANLRGANLRYANLHDTDLTGANLYGADLTYAGLRGANLHDANLAGADLRRADLTGADLAGANLRGADLSYAGLRGADLRGANLRYADLWYADLYRANLADVKTDEHTLGFHLACPVEGEFIGWKKAHGLIVKLKVPADAKRSSAATNKCRCSKAEVLAIEELDGTPSAQTMVSSDRDPYFVYEIGKTVEVNDFDEDRWRECSTGIHFFMNREEAVNW